MTEINPTAAEFEDMLAEYRRRLQIAANIPDGPGGCLVEVRSALAA